MITQISNIQDKFEVTKEMEKVIHEVVNEVQKVEQVGEEVEISFALVDDEYIKELNYNYRNMDCATDVLSFAFRDSEEAEEIPSFQGVEEQEEILGDIIISLERAQEQAQEYGHSFTRELAFLTVHGALHLLGYDHMEEDEQKIMRAREEKILQGLKINR